MKKVISFLILLSVLLVGCNNNSINTNKKEDLNEINLKYEEFVYLAENFSDDFKPINFIKASPDGVLIKHILTFPDGLKLEKRNNDGLQGDTSRPSKYTFYYLDELKSAIVKVSFVYQQTQTSGIMLQSITSPADNIGLDDNFKILNRPFAINKILSMKNYLIIFEYYLLNPEKQSGSNDEKIKELINIDIDFYKQVENYLVNKNKMKS